MLVEKRKLNKAFRLMQKRGIVARQNFYCCFTCATFHLRELAKRRLEAGKPAKGYAFYHSQNEDSRIAGENFHIAYGEARDRRDRAELSIVEVGKIVCECLSEAGVPWWWEGDPDVRIEVIQEDGPTPQSESSDEESIPQLVQ